MKEVERTVVEEGREEGGRKKEGGGMKITQ
jgi:hypothetical protein